MTKMVRMEDKIMCGRYYVSDDTAREMEKMVRDLDRKLAVYRSGDVSPSGMATVLVQPEKRSV